MSKHDLVIVSDPLSSEFGPTRPVILVAEELSKKGFQVTIVSLTVSLEVRELCESKGISVFDISGKTCAHTINESLAWFRAWLSDALFSSNSRKAPKLEGTILNFSNVIAVPSSFWYAQGPPTVTLRNIKPALSVHYRLVYDFAAPFLNHLDRRTARKFAGLTDNVVVNSKYLMSIYHEFGVEVHDVIYPPLDCEVFKPRGSNNSSAYMLSYFGKETKTSLLKKLADSGVKVKLFGGKITTIPRKLQKHPNITLLGKVSNDELARLYSEALLTIYPFLDEPFGYIPVESMSCGTPVLTYNSQGPSESVIHGLTGWLVDNDEVFTNLAIQVWNNGYESTMRKECRGRALMFDKKEIARKWLQLLKAKDS
jgi:glycosyltransferase involved in cell wall biosynthesis